MITSLRLIDFKNFADESLRVGPFTVIVGANASGKSNIRDAFRFLHGIGRGYTLAEVIGGMLEWAPIRGAANEIIRISASPSGLPVSPNPAFGLGIEMTVEGTTAKYEVEASTEIGKRGFRITYERLRMGGKTIYEKCRGAYGEREVVVENDHSIDVHLDIPALGQVLGKSRSFQNEGEPVKTINDLLLSMRFFEFSPDRMREPTFPDQTRLGDRGENLPAVLMEICDDPKRKTVLIEWIRELTPMDVKDFEFPADPSGRVHLVIRETDGRRISAYSASDGTLRFLAMLAALLGKDSRGLYFFEEIENGLHPSRLHLLVDLIERQTAKGRVQVIATTHSPDLLSMVSDETFENTSVTCRLEDANDAIIRPVANLSNARKLRKTQGLGRLLAGGWMEDVLAFTVTGEDDEESSR